MSNQEFDYSRISFATVQAYLEGRLDTDTSASILMQSLHDKVLQSRIELTRLLMEIFLGNGDYDDENSVHEVADESDDDGEYDDEYDDDGEFDDDDDDDDEDEFDLDDAINQYLEVRSVDGANSIAPKCDCSKCTGERGSFGDCPSSLDLVRHAYSGVTSMASTEIEFHLSLCERCRHIYAKMCKSAEYFGLLPPPPMRQARLDSPDQEG